MLIEYEVPIEEAEFFVLDGALFETARDAVDLGQGIGLCISTRRVVNFESWEWWDTAEEDEWVQVARLPKVGLTPDGGLKWWKSERKRATAGTVDPAPDLQPSLFEAPEC